ncbi:methyltransferase domain-containing protein [Planctomyces sp. SH-PL62]|uniref:methyltransferase domain-containing protein n=1 Tax=Planctomyces sp. SH-PL62 TaxID=1636152 RepID=UPI00078D5D83|nr:methyltransferase domain-containing protein [Planctomyces sp. SH-PL62]AMV39433.1 16S ribosomal RNA methyltransferase KsgA/Dim1 family protein [Planctomyces sp. SH-PL62]
MSDFTLFLGKFLRQGTAIASLAPSSRWLARATLRGIDWDRPNLVVELGAGTGPITRALAERTAGRSRALIVERDPDFAAILRDRYGDHLDLEVVRGDVRDLADMLRDRGIEQVDHILSGLPTPSLPKDLQTSLFRVVRRALKPEGSFNQITEMPLVYRGLYRRFFEDVRFVFEPRNIPPAGVYLCRRIKPEAVTS